MHVAELMPCHPSKSRPFGGRLQYAREQLRLPEWVALLIWEDQIVWGRSRRSRPMIGQHLDRVRPQRNRPQSPLRLGSLTLALEDRLEHPEGAVRQVQAAPPQAEHLPNSQPRERHEPDHRSIRFLDLQQERPDVLMTEDTRRGPWRRQRELDAARGIHGERAVFHRGIENAGQHDPHVPDRLPRQLLIEAVE